MIEELRISELGIISEAVLPLAPGFTVLTGETGAGKTMVLTGLALVLGAAVDSGVVRVGAGRAVVEARICGIPADVAARVEDAGGALEDDGSLLLVRSVAAQGRSRAVAGGRTVPMSVLAELGAGLVTVHGQGEASRLLSPAAQRDLIDQYAGPNVTKLRHRWRTAYDRLRLVEAERLRLHEQAQERRREAELLRLGLSDVASVDPQPDEDSRLRAEAERLGHADQLRTAAAQGHRLLTGDPDDPLATDAAALLATTAQIVGSAAEHDARLRPLAARVTDLQAQSVDLAADLAGYADSVDADPARLAATEDRRAALRRLTRAYGETVAEVLAWAAQATTRLAVLEADQQTSGDLDAERNGLRATLAEIGPALSRERRVAGDRLAGAVEAELTMLAMPRARVAVRVTQDCDAAGLPTHSPDVGVQVLAYGPSGLDSVAIELAPHSGASWRPVAKAASGGERSRVMLALEVALLGADPVPTMVFDEVDAGVGGAAAVEVGRRLAHLGQHAQVLVVTHLPQVAAFADRHLAVRKNDDGSITQADVEQLDAPGRIHELARMLAGQEHSASAAAHAEELLELAAADRSEDSVLAAVRPSGRRAAQPPHGRQPAARHAR